MIMQNGSVRSDFERVAQAHEKRNKLSRSVRFAASSRLRVLSTERVFPFQLPTTLTGSGDITFPKHLRWNLIGLYRGASDERGQKTSRCGFKSNAVPFRSPKGERRKGGRGIGGERKLQHDTQTSIRC